MITKEQVWVYDIETYPNYFCLVTTNMATRERHIFVICDWLDQAQELVQFIYRLRDMGHYMLGYNNFGFDYPVIHHFLTLCDQGIRPTAHDLYMKAMVIIDAPRNDWTHTVWESDHFVPQIDVFKIMHYDNFARSTSLKKLEVAMRKEHVEDLPIPVGSLIRPEDERAMLWYCCWDVSCTLDFAITIWDRITFRFELDERYGGKTRVNYNDTKIGKNHFIDTLEQRGIKTRQGGQPIQTPRTRGIAVADFLIPVEFESPTLSAVYNMFLTSVIPPQNTKGFFTGKSGYARDFQLDFGTGGLHGSIHKKTVHSTDEWVIMDADVVSYYPSLAIRYGFYPEHMGTEFTTIYSDMLAERRSHAKGTSENAMLKLALNGSYGESNNKYSSFYDPQMTMAITITGQLLLAKLMEMLLMNAMCQPIQANTDGLTVRLPRAHLDWYYQVCKAWEDWSRMELEYVEYKTMAIRDVNNYISIDTDGKAKLKGAYNPKPDFHQDHSSLVVQKAVKALVEDGLTLDHYIYKEATDPYDFMRSAKVPRSSRLMWGDTAVPNITRYYIAHDGKPLVKIMPPLAGNTDEREIGIDKGWDVGICNYTGDFNWSNLNRRWYLDEAEKLAADLGL